MKKRFLAVFMILVMGCALTACDEEEAADGQTADTACLLYTSNRDIFRKCRKCVVKHLKMELPDKRKSPARP